MHLHKETGRIALIGSPPGFFITSLQFPQQKQQIRTHDQSAKGSDYIALVEAGRVELPSENTSTGTSPGAFGYLHSLACTGAETLTDSVAS